MSSDVQHKFASFREFYPFYLGEHRNTTCRRLHFTGTSFALGFILLAVTSGNAWWFLGALLSGFVLVANFGLPGTLACAAALNVLIAVIALAHREQHAPIVEDTAVSAGTIDNSR